MYGRDTLFQHVHSPDRIFAVLIEGQPPSVFPDLLVKDGVEPLAVDLRDETLRVNSRAFEDATLRLVAAIVGCKYDDLRGGIGKGWTEPNTLDCASFHNPPFARAFGCLGMSFRKEAASQRMAAGENARRAKNSLESAVKTFEISERQFEQYLTETVLQKDYLPSPSEVRRLQEIADDIESQTAKLIAISRELNREPDEEIKWLLALGQWHLASISRHLRSPEEAIDLYNKAGAVFDTLFEKSSLGSEEFGILQLTVAVHLLTPARLPKP